MQLEGLQELNPIDFLPFSTRQNMIYSVSYSNEVHTNLLPVPCSLFPVP
jgi:hypothetical protein